MSPQNNAGTRNNMSAGNASAKTTPQNRIAKRKELRARTKKSLKTMRKTRNRHPLRTQMRIMKYGMSGFARNIWLSVAATVVMTVALIILFVTVVGSQVLRNTARSMEESIDITIYVQPNTPQEILDQMAATLKQDPNVLAVDPKNSAQEYEILQQENADADVAELMQSDEMRQLILAETKGTLRVKVDDVGNIDRLKNTVENDELFKRYVDREQMPTYEAKQMEIATINNWATFVSYAGLVLAVVFLVISTLIVFSTIRMAIFSRREEIYMEKLVGAEKRFIRGPFLVEADICGIIAGILAVSISYAGVLLLAPHLNVAQDEIGAIVSDLRSSKLLILYAAFIVLGVLISRISAWLAISKYLHKT